MTNKMANENKTEWYRITLRVDFVTKEEIKAILKKKLKHVETRMSYVDDRLCIDLKCSHHKIFESLAGCPWFITGCIRRVE